MFRHVVAAGATLRAAEAIPVSASATPVHRSQLRDACEKVKLEASKVAVMWSSGSHPSAREAASVLQSYQQAFLHLCTMASTCPPHPTQSLIDARQVAKRRVVNAGCALLTGLMVMMEGTTEAQPLAPLAGQLRAGCDDLAYAALDNRAAAGRQLSALAASVKDVVREMQGMGEGSLCTGLGDLAAEGSGSDDGGTEAAIAVDGGAVGRADDDDDDILMFDEGEWSDRELAALEAGRSVAVSIMTFLKAVMAHLLKQDSGLGGQDGGQAWEAAVGHLQALRAHMDDLGAALYPPQDSTGILEAVDRVHRAAGASIASLQSGEHQGEVGVSLVAVDKAVQALSRAVNDTDDDSA